MMSKKIYSFIAASFIGAATFAQSFVQSTITPANQLETLGMSANGRYIVGLNVATFKGFIWDVKTDNVIENNGDHANCDFRSITDDGVAYGILGTEDMVTTNAARFSTNGVIEYMETKMSQIFDVTPDGSIAVGCLLDEIMWWPTACYWKNGERYILPCPTELECGIENDGANAQYVSADGKVIVGYLQDTFSSRPAIIWTQQEDGTYKYDLISKDVWELHYGEGKTYLKFEPLAVSDNGKWIALAAQKEAGDYMPTPEFMIRMNLETGVITESSTPDIEYFMPETDNCYPTGIANDGTCIGCATDELGYRRGVIWKSDSNTPILLSAYYSEIKELTTYDGFMHLPIYITADAKTIAGYACPVTADLLGNVDFDYQAYRLSENGSTGVSSFKNVSLSGNSYGLSGRPINDKRPSNGIVIRNNKKFLVK